jgi:hypothetical protein
MMADSLDARTMLALQEVAGEHDLTLWRQRLYGNGDTIVAFSHRSAPDRLSALLPIDQTLRARMTALRHTRAGLRRILRADAFGDQGGRGDARDLCRLGLVGCHALTETLPPEAIGPGLRVRVLFDEPGVEVMTEGPSTARVTMGPALVRLLWQFRPVDRYAQAFHAFHRQLASETAYRARG